MRYQFERTDLEEEQCKHYHYKKVEGSDYCPRHGANKQLKKQAKEMTYQFLRDEVRAKINYLAADPNRYKLDEDLAIMRATLEDLINKLDQTSSLYQHSETIGSMIMRIEKLVQACTIQSTRLKLLMTPEDLQNTIQSIVDIIAEEITDDEIVIRIATRIGQVLSSTIDTEATFIENSIPAKQLGQDL